MTCMFIVVIIGCIYHHLWSYFIVESLIWSQKITNYFNFFFSSISHCIDVFYLTLFRSLLYFFLQYFVSLYYYFISNFYWLGFSVVLLNLHIFFFACVRWGNLSLVHSDGMWEQKKRQTSWKKKIKRTNTRTRCLSWHCGR